MSVFKALGRALAPVIPTSILRSLNRPASLYFHGVEIHLSGHEIERIHHRADDFQRMATALKNAFDVLPMRAMADVLRAPQKNRRALFLTFDDGYANNILAAEILKSLNLPWTLFVSTHHVETGETDPVFMARLFFVHAPAGLYEIPHFERPVLLKSTYQRKRAMDHGVAKLKRLKTTYAQDALETMVRLLGPDKLERLVAQTPAKSFLSWDDVRTIRTLGAEIGSHAVVHWPMHRDQNREYLRDQAVHSKAAIEAQIGPCRYFAYPFGRRHDCTTAWRAVRDAGFDYGFTAIPGTLDASSNPWLLPRYGVGIHETALSAMIPMLRANNGRFRRWQRQIES